ncbi:MAG: transposase [Planctomycetota bacterium]
MIGRNTIGNLPSYRYNKRPDSIAGDKGYSGKAIRNLIASRSITAVIPSRSNESRSDSFDRASYRNRNIVERPIGWLKESRRIATRYDKLRCTYIAFVYLAATRRAIALL